MKSFLHNTGTQAKAVSQTVISKTNTAATTVAEGVNSAASHVQDSVVSAAEQIQQGMNTAATSLNQIAKSPIITKPNDALPTLLSHFKYTYENGHILSEELNKATLTLKDELSVRKNPAYDDDAIRIWNPNTAEVQRTLQIFTKAQDLMCTQIFSAHKRTNFNTNNNELATNYKALDTLIGEIYQSPGTETKIIYKDGLNPNNINQNFKAFHLQMQDLYSDISYGPIRVLNNLVDEITKAKKLLESSKTLLNGQIASIENNIAELSTFISEIETDMREELNEKNPALSLYEDQLAIYHNQLEELTQTNTILKKMISGNNPENSDTMSHCITPEEYAHIHAHPRANYIDEQAAINKNVDIIARAMIRISPGMERIRAGIDEIEDMIISTLVGSAVQSMARYLTEMSASLLATELTKQQRTYQLASYLSLIAAFYDRVTLLSSSEKKMIYRGNEVFVGELIRKAEFNNDVPAMVAASKAFNAAIKPIVEATETFLHKLVDEVNHQINGIDESKPGFLRQPDQALANNIVENLKCFNIVICIYSLLIEDDEAIQKLSQFNVDGETLRTRDDVINKLFDILTKSITYHIDVSKLNDTKADLKTAVLGYTTLKNACELHGALVSSNKLEIMEAALNIKNRYIQKLRLIDDVTAFVVIQRIIDYSDHFYQHVAGPLAIKWISKEELMLELIEVFISNPSYMTRSKEIKDEHHREMHKIITRLIKKPISDLYTHIFPVQGAETSPEQSLALNNYDASMKVDQEDLEALYIKVLKLILRNNPYIHEISFERGLPIKNIMMMCIRSSDQVHSFISDSMYTLQDYMLESLMLDLPGVQLFKVETALTTTTKQTTINRTRPIAREKDIAVIETQEIDNPNDNNTNISVKETVSEAKSHDTSRNLVKSLKQKSQTMAKNIKERTAQALHGLFNENNNAAAHEMIVEPEPKIDKLLKYRTKADKDVQNIFSSEQDIKIYNLLRKHHMIPRAAFDDQDCDATLDSFNGVAIRIHALSPSIEFIKGMAYLSLSQSDIAKAASWTESLKELSPEAYAALAYKLITQHESTLQTRGLYQSILESLINNVKASPFNIMPHEYIRVIAAALVNNRCKKEQILALIDSYLQARDCLYDYDDFDSLNAHYDIIQACIDNENIFDDNAKSKIFDMLLRSNVYGTVTTRKHLKKVLSNSTYRFTEPQVESLLTKVDALNLRIAEHIKTLFIHTIHIVKRDLGVESSVELNRAELNFDNHMLVLMNNVSEGKSETPLHAPDNSLQNELDSAFVSGLIHHFYRFKECINFKKHAANYICHLVKLHISEQELIKVIDAATQLTLANMRNVEHELVLLIEMIAQQFPVPSAQLNRKLTDLKNKIIERKLLKVMNSMLFHFNATQLPDAEIKELRKNVLDIQNEHDGKAMPQSLSEITKLYRSLLGSESFIIQDINAVRHEIDFIITFCEKASSMNEESYKRNHHSVLIQASRINMSLLSNEINIRLSTLIEGLATQPKPNDLAALKQKMQGMYTKIMEILVMKSIPHLKTPDDFIIIKTLLEQRKNNTCSAEILLASAYASANIQSNYTLHYRSGEDRGIVTMLKAISPAMIEHMDDYTIAVLHKCVSSKIQKPTDTHLQFIM